MCRETLLFRISIVWLGQKEKNCLFLAEDEVELSFAVTITLFSIQWFLFNKMDGVRRREDQIRSNHLGQVTGDNTRQGHLYSSP